MVRKICVYALLIAFALTNGVPSVYAQEAIALPASGTRLELSPVFAPPLLKGIKVYRNDPFRFDFILDKGDSSQTDDQLKTDSNRLIKYFLASLTVPEKDLWVNLSPYERDRIVPEAFGQTEMGRDLLAQDYILKQITASVIYPEEKVGKDFWNQVYAEALKRFGTTDVPVDTFNKVWIIPEKASVYQKDNVAFVVDSKLKVLLEEDYLALANNPTGKTAPTMNKLGSDIVRKVVIPVLEKEVNEGKNFAPLRQVYSSLILATWYKRKVKASILGQAYVDKEKTNGVDIADKNEKDKIWKQYVDAFKKGAFNIIKEDDDGKAQVMIPRQYFSGGAGLFQIGRVFSDSAMLPESNGHFLMLRIKTDAVIDIDKAMSVPSFKNLLQQIDGNPKTKEKLFILSNEQKQLEILRSLASRRLTPNSVYVGFSGMLNLDIIAARRPAFGIIGGIDEGHKIMYAAIERALRDERILDKKKPLSQRRTEFVELLLDNFEHDGVFLQDVFEEFAKDSRGAELRKHLQQRERWIASDESFEYIQSMFLDGRLGFVCLNITDFEKFHQIGSWVRENGLIVDSIFTSNIFAWLGKGQSSTGLPDSEPQMRFLKSLGYIADANTLVINAHEGQLPDWPFIEILSLNNPNEIAEHTWMRALAVEVSTFKGSEDDAMSNTSNTGGIDFNPDKLNISAKGDNLTFNVDPAIIQKMQKASGIVAVIVDIKPLDSLPLFLGTGTK